MNSIRDIETYKQSMTFGEKCIFSAVIIGIFLILLCASVVLKSQNKIKESIRNMQNDIDVYIKVSDGKLNPYIK